jgi:hypothetical protein
MPQSSVATFAKGATIRCRLRLDLEHLGNSDTYVCLIHYTSRLIFCINKYKKKGAPSAAVISPTGNSVG